jgi:hypothetical protein
MREHILKREREEELQEKSVQIAEEHGETKATEKSSKQFHALSSGLRGDLMKQSQGKPVDLVTDWQF